MDCRDLIAHLKIQKEVYTDVGQIIAAISAVYTSFFRKQLFDDTTLNVIIPFIITVAIFGLTIPMRMKRSIIIRLLFFGAAFVLCYQVARIPRVDFIMEDYTVNYNKEKQWWSRRVKFEAGQPAAGKRFYVIVKTTVENSIEYWPFMAVSSEAGRWHSDTYYGETECDDSSISVALVGDEGHKLYKYANKIYLTADADKTNFADFYVGLDELTGDTQMLTDWKKVFCNKEGYAVLKNNSSVQKKINFRVGMNFGLNIE